MIFSLFRNTFHSHNFPFTFHSKKKQKSWQKCKKNKMEVKKNYIYFKCVIDRTTRPDRQTILSSPLPPSIVYFYFFLSTINCFLFNIIKFYNFIYRTHAYQSTPLLISCRSSFTTLCRQITCFNRRHRTTCPTGMTLHKK